MSNWARITIIFGAAFFGGLLVAAALALPGQTSERAFSSWVIASISIALTLSALTPWERK